MTNLIRATVVFLIVLNMLIWSLIAVFPRVIFAQEIYAYKEPDLARDVPEVVYLEPVPELVQQNTTFELENVIEYLKWYKYYFPEDILVVVGPNKDVLVEGSLGYSPTDTLEGWQDAWSNPYLKGVTTQGREKNELIIIVNGETDWYGEWESGSTIKILTHELIHTSQAHRGCGQGFQAPSLLKEGEARLMENITASQLIAGKYPLERMKVRELLLESAYQPWIRHELSVSEAKPGNLYGKYAGLEAEEYYVAESFVAFLLLQSPGGRDDDIASFHQYFESLCSPFISVDRAFVNAFGWEPGEAFVRYDRWRTRILESRWQ